ncbi:MAG: stage II sporulation protein P [Thermoanaerobacteraceae bacterium]|nr:stage II sporulation protein P [Thermoanaerobacteraceae bacterium]
MKSAPFFSNEVKFCLIFFYICEYAYFEDVISLIKIKVIKIRGFILFIVVIMLIISFIVSAASQLNQRTVAVMAYIQTENRQNFIHKIDSKIFERIICKSLPTLETINKKNKAVIDFRSLMGNFSRILTNVDILNPETYFFMHLPLISVINTETAMTPGVELPQGSKFYENEHESSENLPPPEKEELEEAEVEKLDTISDQPLVLIYHTHTTEGYMPSEKFNYTPDSTYHTKDLNFSVAKVGEVLADELNRLNIPTMHNKTFHDIPTYMTSYANSLKTAEKLLKQNPSIKIVIDLHRDAPVSDPQKSREITTVKIDGTIYSRFLLVVGTDKTFPHPHWKENYRFANLLNDKLEQLYPGISRGIDLRSERFNQHLSKKAILLEIGSHGNSMEEALTSAKVFAKVLADIVKELSITE